MTQIIYSYEHGHPLAECPNNASLSRLGLKGTGEAPFMGSEALGVFFWGAVTKARVGLEAVRSDLSGNGGWEAIGLGDGS